MNAVTISNVTIASTDREVEFTEISFSAGRASQMPQGTREWTKWQVEDLPASRPDAAIGPQKTMKTQRSCRDELLAVV
jgi:hypothetical protein